MGVKRFHQIVAVLAAGFSCSQCPGALVTNLQNFPAPSVVDFAQFQTTNTFGPGPVEVGETIGESVIWTANTHQSLIVSTSNGSYGLGANGVWAAPMSFAGVNNQTDGETNSMRFTFKRGPVRGVGGTINYVPNNPAAFRFAKITALDTNGAVVETYDLMSVAPIATNAGAFRGILRDNDDIAAFELSNAVMTIDDLRFCRNPPFLLSASHLGTGRLQLIISSPAPRSISIEVSTNLESWLPLTSVSNETGMVSYEDLQTTNSSMKFYRAFMIP